MSEEKSLDLRADRREFTLAAMLAMLGGVSMTISGCGKASSPAGPSTPVAPPVSDKTGSISGNHGHVAVITSGQLTAANTLALSLKGTSSHDHTLELTAADLVEIRDGQRFEKECGTGHKHVVTFN
jgi:hypothetical protein